MSLHPILSASALPERWREADVFCVLDSDFGSGGLFFAAWSLWRQARGGCNRLHYIAICDTHSRPAVATESAHSLQSLAEELSRQWPMDLPGFHRLELDQGRVLLTLVRGSVEQEIPRIEASCDALLVGANATKLNAAGLARLSKPGAILATTCLDSDWLDSLNNAGFALAQNTPVATATFRTRKRHASRLASTTDRREAIVIGAGLAGTSAAAALSKSGWSVSIIERHPAPAQEASGNLAAVFSPMLSKDDGHAARLSRASFLTLRQELSALSRTASPPLWDACGVLQLAKTPKEEQLFTAIAEQHKYPAAYASFLSQEEAGIELQQPVAAGGWLFPGGGWLNPVSLCRARLAAHPGIRQLFGNGVLEIRRKDGIWQTIGAGERVLAEAPVLILANAYEAAAMAPQAGLQFKKVRGQVTHLRGASLPPLQKVLTRDGYLTPPVAGVCCIGATYDFNSDASSARAESDQSNLERLPQLLPGIRPEEVQCCGARVAFRSLTPDRMPIVGAIASPQGNQKRGRSHDIAREPGLYALLGLGSRGAVWSTLAGEILASLLNGEPAPVGSDLLESIDPARFALRDLTRARDIPTF